MRPCLLCTRINSSFCEDCEESGCLDQFCPSQACLDVIDCGDCIHWTSDPSVEDICNTCMLNWFNRYTPKERL